LQDSSDEGDSSEDDEDSEEEEEETPTPKKVCAYLMDLLFFHLSILTRCIYATFFSQR
jgi:hypothetical protein